MLEKTRIGRKICERRKECGISIVELADKIGVGCGVVSNWENGVEMPDITYLQPLADTLDVTIDYIIRDNCFSKDDQSATNNMPDNCPEDSSFIQAHKLYLSGNIPMFCALLESFNAETLSRIFEIVYKDGNIQVVTVMADYVSQTDLNNCAIYAYATNNRLLCAAVIAKLDEKNISVLKNMATMDNRLEIMALLAMLTE